jgi:hypothetical protein
MVHLSNGPAQEVGHPTVVDMLFMSAWSCTAISAARLPSLVTFSSARRISPKFGGKVGAENRLRSILRRAMLSSRWTSLCIESEWA